jgi:hypothetical protein
MGAAGGAIVGALGGVVGTALQISSSRRSEKEAEREAKRRSAAQQQLVAGLAEQDARSRRARALAAGRQQTIGGADPGLRSTILTGPSGLAASAPGEAGGKKTLLGE